MKNVKVIVMIVLSASVCIAAFQEINETLWGFKSHRAAEAATKYEKGSMEAKKNYEAEIIRLKDAFKKELEIAIMETAVRTDPNELSRIRDAIQFLSNETDITSKDISLQFELEKSEWSSIKTTNIWGKVKNMSNKTYKEVQVIITAQDEAGKFLGRKTWYVDPDNIGPEQVGFIEEKFVETQKKPARLIFKVIGKEIE